MTDATLLQLAQTIKTRRDEVAAKSYTRHLLDGGAERCARKLGEEAVETIIAALGSDKAALTNEAADLVYHLLVLLECRDVEIGQVLAVLQGRMGVSGHEEKAARS